MVVMTVLRFTGVVTEGDASRVSYDEDDGAIHIGDSDVIAGIDAAAFSGPVTVAIADERFTEDSLVTGLGWGYSEFTPLGDDRLTLGPHNLIEVLGRYVDQEITMWIADEPVDLGEQP